MSITTLKARFARIVTEISEQREQLALIYASDLTAKITDRLLNEGVSADGKKFPLYSEKNLPLKVAEALIKKSNRPSAKIKQGETSYKDVRKTLGLPTDKRTHSFTNDMIKSIRPTVADNNKYLTIVEIKSSDAANQKKLNENSKRMGVSLLKANQKEKQLIEDLNLERIKNIINK